MEGRSGQRLVMKKGMLKPRAAQPVSRAVNGCSTNTDLSALSIETNTLSTNGTDEAYPFDLRKRAEWAKILITMLLTDIFVTGVFSYKLFTYPQRSIWLSFSGNILWKGY